MEYIYDSVQNTFQHKVASELADKLHKYMTSRLIRQKFAFITIHLRGAKRKNLNDTSLNNRCEENKIKAFVNKVEIHFRYDICRFGYFSRWTDATP